MFSLLGYIDPGAGSLLFQALLSAGITLLVFAKKIWFFIKGVFLSLKKGKRDD